MVLHACSLALPQVREVFVCMYVWEFKQFMAVLHLSLWTEALCIMVQSVLGNLHHA